MTLRVLVACRWSVTLLGPPKTGWAEKLLGGCLKLSREHQEHRESRENRDPPPSFPTVRQSPHSFQYSNSPFPPWPPSKFGQLRCRQFFKMSWIILRMISNPSGAVVCPEGASRARTTPRGLRSLIVGLPVVRMVFQGDVTHFCYVDINISDYIASGKGGNIIQGSMSLNNKIPDGCTEIIPGFHQDTVRTRPGS